jgi:hypothetical protein
VKQTAADHLRVGREQAEAVAVTVAGHLVGAQLGEGGLELDVAREQGVGRAHFRIQDVVADPGQVR